jgi:hypothetical protein
MQMEHKKYAYIENLLRQKPQRERSASLCDMCCIYIHQILPLCLRASRKTHKDRVVIRHRHRRREERMEASSQ